MRLNIRYKIEDCQPQTKFTGSYLKKSLIVTNFIEKE